MAGVDLSLPETPPRAASSRPLPPPGLEKRRADDGQLYTHQEPWRGVCSESVSDMGSDAPPVCRRLRVAVVVEVSRSARTRVRIIVVAEDQRFPVRNGVRSSVSGRSAVGPRGHGAARGPEQRDVTRYQRRCACKDFLDYFGKDGERFWRWAGEQEACRVAEEARAVIVDARRSGRLQVAHTRGWVG